MALNSTQRKIVERSIAQQPNAAELLLQVANDIEKSFDIKHRLLQIRQEELAEDNRHQEAVAMIARKRAAIRGDCLHVWEHHYSPCGGSDSYDECEICGKTK